MQSRMIDTQPNTYAVIFAAGDEVTAGLAAFAQERHLSASHFTAIGGFQEVTLGYFDWDKKEYKRHRGTRAGRSAVSDRRYRPG